MDRADAAVVEGNRVTSTTGVGGAQGSPAQAIHVMNSKGVQVVGNRIANLETVPNSYGIRVWNGTNVAVRDNVVSFMVFGVAYMGSSSGKYMGNLTTGVNVPYTYGTAAGPNY
jgi:nitrous oxidase accessory protein NosD